MSPVERARTRLRDWSMPALTAAFPEELDEAEYQDLYNRWLEQPEIDDRAWEMWH